MGSLVIKHKVHTVLRKAIGVIIFLQGIIWLLIHIGQMNLFHWAYSVFFAGIGFAQFFTAFGSDTSEVLTGYDSMRIKWVSWLKPKIIHYSEIDKLTFTMFDIEISSKDKKVVRLRLDFMERIQMKEVREFFLNLTGIKA